MPSNQIGTFIKRIKEYFRFYGGWDSIFQSPFFLTSILITAINYQDWLEPNWAELSKSLIPSLLGFSLGAYAILFGMLTGRMKKALKATRNTRGISYLDEINATFFHFIFVQVICLIWSITYFSPITSDFVKLFVDGAPQNLLTARRFLSITGSFIGLFLEVYSVTLIVASALAVYRLARIVDQNP